MLEVPILVKPLLWVLGLQAVFYVLALRPWRWRELPRALSPSIDLTFVALVVAGALALLDPRPFDLASQRLVEQTSLPDSMAIIDAEFADLETMPARVWEEIKASFGFSEPPPAVPPSAVLRPGAVESAVVGAVEEMVSMLMRAYVYLGVVLGLWLVWVVRLFVRSSTARRLRDERAWQTLVEAEWTTRSETVVTTPADRSAPPHL